MLLQGNLQGFQHLGLPVTDLVRSKAFYQELGFEDVMRTALPAQDEAVEVAMLKKDDFTIELYQLTGQERKEIATRSDGHIDHIALSVLDIEKAYAEITAAGLEVLEEDAPRFLPFWTRGVKFFTIRGPDGEKVEFNQILR
jgi:catechol 2,3-dioxygenase-like lactoylglutathione lyase family enzyme